MRPMLCMWYLPWVWKDCRLRAHGLDFGCIRGTCGGLGGHSEEPARAGLPSAQSLEPSFAHVLSSSLSVLGLTYVLLASYRVCSGYTHARMPDRSQLGGCVAVMAMDYKGLHEMLTMGPLGVTYLASGQDYSLCGEPETSHRTGWRNNYKRDPTI